VVITRGTDAHRHVPAAVAGQIYRDLSRRFGTPAHVQLASTSDDEENEDDAATAQTATGNNATVAPVTTRPLINSPAPRNNVRTVLMPIPSRTGQTSNATVSKSPTTTKDAGKPAAQPDDRSRRTQSPRP
jgi:hypothetical protein